MESVRKHSFSSVSAVSALRLRIKRRRQRLAAALAGRRRRRVATAVLPINAPKPSLSAWESVASQAPPTTALAPSCRRLSTEERIEMRRLSALLPARLSVSASGRRRVAAARDALQVVTSAAKYISQLTATVVARVQNGTLPREVLDGLPSGATLLSSAPSRAAAGPLRRSCAPDSR